MNLKELNFSLPSSRRQTLLLLSLLTVTVINLFILAPENERINAFKQQIEHQLIGYEFIGIRDFIPDEKYVGFYTDLDPSEKKGGKLFSHAQYHLAPSILEFNNTDRPVVIFACSSELVAWQKIHELGLDAFKKNNFGVILARQKR